MNLSKENINLALILEGCLANNRASQKRLYEHFYGYALKVSLSYSKGIEEAKEVMNDAFYKVFTHIDRYDRERPFKAWLRRIVVNAAIDHQRKNKVKFQTVSLEHVDVGYEDAAIIPSDFDIVPILQKLSPQYRTVFNLYVLEGYKHDEIAERLGINVGTSRSNLLRAKAKLKSWISEQSSNAKAN